jgi:hypothetical protein
MEQLGSYSDSLVLVFVVRYNCINCLLTQIWLKDAVQCQVCAMTCHKKCVAKCLMGTLCSPRGSHRRASALPEDVGQSRGLELLGPPTQVRRASAQPEIITTAADDGDKTPQVSPWCYCVMYFADKWRPLGQYSSLAD